jgi:hypothetical protein
MDIQKKIIPFITFFVIANPETFKLVRSIAGNWVASADGCPTTAGLLLHALVFVIVCCILQSMFYGKSGYTLNPADI